MSTQTLFLNVSLFLCLLLGYGRGLAELYATKAIGYYAQAAALLAFLILLVAIGLRHGLVAVRIEARRNLITFFGLMSCMFISATLTVARNSFSDIHIYLAVSIYLSALIVGTSSLRFSVAERVHFGPYLLFISLLLVSVAWCEQAGVIGMPGSWSIFGVVRPASITGSKQHYSIVAGMLTLVLAEMYEQRRRVAYLVGSAVTGVGTILSATRSGAMILLGGIVFYVVQGYFVRKGKLSSAIVGIVALTVMALFVLHQDNVYVYRVLSAFDLESEGNVGRLESWSGGLRLFGESPVIFGDKTGMVTLSTNRLAGVESFVVESGLLQQVLNFGLLGAGLFYYLLIGIWARIDRAHLWLRSMVLASIAQSLVYQSIEVLPFMMTLILAPVVSDSFGASRGITSGHDGARRMIG